VRAFGISVTVIVRGLFSTEMSAKLPGYRVSASSPYAAAFDALHDLTVAELKDAGDPDEVARAIEECVRAGDPPARIVVGTDAVEMAGMAGTSSAEDVARLLGESVAGLTS
jgi:NAD(P)-dependent dehydrogenase (short-subunit alcohol dehydrogenase family)